MHLGAFVQDIGQKNSLGIIIRRPMVSGCWLVKWTSGPNAGGSTIIQEDNIRLAKV
jgi:hypothetical protein